MDGFETSSSILMDPAFDIIEDPVLRLEFSIYAHQIRNGDGGGLLAEKLRYFDTLLAEHDSTGKKILPDGFTRMSLEEIRLRASVLRGLFAEVVETTEAVA